MSKSSKNNKENRYTIELTTTQACNFRCKYCFENDKETPEQHLLSKNLDFVKQQLHKLFTDKWFLQEFDSFQLVFWGGEPSLNIDMINNVVDEFLNNEKVNFYIYTNGSMINSLLPILLKCKQTGGKEKFKVQISYDGNPVSDMTRIPKDGRTSSEIFKNAAILLKENDLRFSVKATLEHKNFKYLPEVWEDFHTMYKEFGDNIKYALTADYHNIEVSKYYGEIEKALLQVAKKEKQFLLDHNKMLSTIFDPKKADCSAGRQSSCIDIDGQVYLCHGCLYSCSKKDLCYTSIFSNAFVDDIKNKSKEIKLQHKNECDNCVALLCLRCNVKKYENSTKSDFIEKWNDYLAQEEVCKYYKLSGRIGRALLEIIREEKYNVMPS